MKLRTTSMTAQKLSKHKIPYNNLRPAFELAHFELHAAFLAVYDACRYVLGPTLEKFETALAAACRYKHAIGVANGTDALTISLIAGGITNGKKVLTVANSAPATVLAIRKAGAIPIFADVRKEDGIINVAKLNESKFEGVQAFMPVHLYGRIAELDSISGMLNKRGIFVVEDACQAYGSFSPSYEVGSVL